MSTQQRSDRTDAPAKEMVYMASTVAALVEGTQTATYNYLKREILNFIEAMLAAQGVTSSTAPMARVVENILDGARALEWNVIQRVTPAVTGQMVELAGEVRREAERTDGLLCTRSAIENRIKSLKWNLQRAEEDLTKAKAADVAEKLYRALDDTPKHLLPDVLDFVTRTTRKETSGT